MTMTQADSRTTAVGVFSDRSAAEQAVDALRRAGFNDEQIGFAMKGDESAASRAGAADITTDTGPGSGAATGALTGGMLGALAGAAASLLIPGVGPIFAGGILASALGGAALGAAGGGILGGLMTTGVTEDEARYYDEEFRRGGVVVTVKAGSRYSEAQTILQRHGASFHGGATASAPAMRAATTTATTATTATRATTTAENEIRVPEVEERLQVEKRPVQTGEVRIESRVEERQQTVPVTLRQEEVHVERRDVAERPARAGEDAFKEATIRVPVHGEQAVAHKETVVTGEVVVKKDVHAENEQVAGTVRRTEVHVDKANDTVRPSSQEVVHAGDATDEMAYYRTHWQQRYGSSGGRWEDYEPAYRFGHEMRRDARYQGRKFEEVEADLQKDWAQRNPGMTWEKLRANVREAWTDLKSAV